MVELSQVQFFLLVFAAGVVVTYLMGVSHLGFWWDLRDFGFFLALSALWLPFSVFVTTLFY